MRFASTLLIAAVTAACAPAEEEAQPAGPTLADFAGTWELTAKLDGVEEPLSTTVNGTADASSWTMTLGGMDPIPVQVSIQGDSLIAQSGEYISIVREGVPVTVRTALVLQGGMLVGNSVVTYRLADGTEDVAATVSGRRTP